MQVLCDQLLKLMNVSLEPNSSTRTPATNTGYGHHQRTSSQKFYNKFGTSQCQSPTSRHVKMLGCGKFLSVSDVRSRCPCSGAWLLYRVQFDSIAVGFHTDARRKFSRGGGERFSGSERQKTIRQEQVRVRCC